MMATREAMWESSHSSVMVTTIGLDSATLQSCLVLKDGAVVARRPTDQLPTSLLAIQVQARSVG